MTHPHISVVMPVYNTERYVADAVQSVLSQTFADFELLIIDEAGNDQSIAICERFDDPRIRIIHQENRGLAGARNTGIRQARGDLIAFLDSDDMWLPGKLARHVEHFRQSPTLGVSYTGSLLIDDDGVLLKVRQTPKLHDISSSDVFLRNPIGNGSVPVIRREVFQQIAFPGRPGEFDYFDDSFRQSEDIECWTRIRLTTHWRFEGLPGYMTLYRINAGGLSANVIKQFETWSRMRDKIRTYAPEFATEWEAKAEGYQLRYLSRRAVRMMERSLALTLLKRALMRHPGMLVEEPLKTVNSIAAAVALRLLPFGMIQSLQSRLLGGRVAA